MIESNHQPDDSDEAIDPLSATGMFLNAVRQDSGQPVELLGAIEAERLETSPPIPPRSTVADRPPAESTPAGSGEFTRVFRNAQASPPPVQAESQSPSTPAPTDFTRIFVPPPSTPLETPRTEREPVPPRVEVPNSARGFSSPGVSDSAAADGGFTQLFRIDSQRQSAPAHLQAFTSAPPATSVNSEPAGGFTQLFRELPSAPSPDKPLPMVTSVNPSWPSSDPAGSGFTDSFRTTPSSGSPASHSGPLRANSSSPSSFPEGGEWSPQANFERRSKAATSADFSQNATDIFSTLPSSGRQQPEFRSQFDQFQVAPPPTFAPASPHSMPSPAESESVTQLIQMLSPATPQAAATPISRPTDPPQPWAKSGPGEFTRIISREKAPAETPTARPSLQPPPAQGTAAPLIMAATPPLPQIPRVERPQIAAPKPSATAMSKLQEMLPILLVVNAFLMLVLIVVVIYAFQHK